MARALPEIDTPMLTLGREITRSLSVQEQQSLLLLALAGPQPPDVLEQCGLPYRRLLKIGELMRQGPAMALKSKLMQRSVRALATEQDIAQLHDLWVTAAVSLGKEPNAREVLWSLETGKQVPTKLVLDLAEQAARELNFGLALRLCVLGKLARHHGQERCSKRGCC
ncbi:hypothetical protein [Glutamicibacter sp. M10]|uniref:hypothetical protein n=1 Tax=Glutamicibacter sp. M10 TaxID=3023076 RepID=UPI0021CAA97D|nr:hypothetical protein [Glutamicibacter sp. M10]UXN31305.1 hypothetical protein N6V40_13085 [Glutamicibacter sp. M10]